MDGWCTSAEQALDMQLSAIQFADKLRQNYALVSKEPALKKLFCGPDEISDLATGLRQMIPVWWTSKTADVVLSASKTYPPPLTTVPPDDSHCGMFNVFSSPCLTSIIERTKLEFRAIAWMFGRHQKSGQISCSFIGFAEECGFVVPVFIFHMIKGETLFEATMRCGGLSGNQQENAIFINEQISVIRWVGASTRFLEQKILGDKTAKVQRQAHKRAQRIIPDSPGIVRVIEMRIRESSPGNGEPRDIEWSCQWMVRGHWRNQWHPRTSSHVPMWILPYIKGPDDKPLKQPSVDVWKVVR